MEASRRRGHPRPVQELGELAFEIVVAGHELEDALPDLPRPGVTTAKETAREHCCRLRDRRHLLLDVERKQALLEDIDTYTMLQRACSSP